MTIEFEDIKPPAPDIEAIVTAKNVSMFARVLHDIHEKVFIFTDISQTKFIKIMHSKPPPIATNTCIPFYK